MIVKILIDDQIEKIHENSVVFFEKINFLEIFLGFVEILYNY